MKIMDRVLKNTKSIWEDCVSGDFLLEMMNGNLNKQKFLNYIVQDSIYLRDYLKAYAMAIFKCDSLKQMQMFYSVLGFVNDSENATRLKYLQDNSMTDDDVEKVAKLPECAAYTKFLIETSKTQDIPEILMAVMPCMIGYYIVFDKVKSLAPNVLDGYYGALVSDYSSSFYKECCDYWTDFTNKQCENFGEERLAKLNDIFVQASMHELYFWQMAGRE